MIDVIPMKVYSRLGLVICSYLHDLNTSCIGGLRVLKTPSDLIVTGDEEEILYPEKDMLGRFVNF